MGNDPGLRRTQPGKQAITFLLLANISMVNYFSKLRTSFRGRIMWYFSFWWTCSRQKKPASVKVLWIFTVKRVGCFWFVHSRHSRSSTDFIALSVWVHCTQIYILTIRSYIASRSVEERLLMERLAIATTKIWNFASCQLITTVVIPSNFVETTT